MIYALENQQDYLDATGGTKIRISRFPWHLCMIIWYLQVKRLNSRFGKSTNQLFQSKDIINDKVEKANMGYKGQCKDIRG